MTGATRLEPATSGVTGRYVSEPVTGGYDGITAATAASSSPSEPAATGYDRLPPGAAFVVSVWCDRCLARQLSSWTSMGPAGAPWGAPAPSGDAAYGGGAAAVAALVRAADADLRSAGMRPPRPADLPQHLRVHE